MLLYVSYTPYMHILKVILYNILNKFVHKTKFLDMEPSESKGVKCEIFLMASYWCSKISDFGAPDPDFQIKNVLICSLYYVHNVYHHVLHPAVNKSF